MANHYHDELGRFCSKNEMGHAVERLYALMTEAPTNSERAEASSQWFNLKSEYDALATPDYEKKIAELDARIFSTHSRTVLNQLEAERAQLRLEADASDEGFNTLLRESLTNPHPDSRLRFADDWRIEKAAVYRAQRKTTEAVEAYKSGEAPRYESTIELFKDTETKVLRTNKRVYIAEPGSDGYVVQHDFALDDSDFDQQVLELREQIGSRLADREKFNKGKLGTSLYNTDLNAVYLGSTGRTAHIVRSNTSEVLAEVEFNENGAFVSASVSHHSGDGSIKTLNTTPQLRGFLRDANGPESKVPSLPAWKSGRVEKRHAFVAPSDNDIEELDVLF